MTNENLIAEISLKLYEKDNIIRLEAIEQGTNESYSLLSSVIREERHRVEIKKIMALLSTILSFYKNEYL
ncbi:MAG: hypothetical protein D8H93_16085 [Capnocytophaga sp.]|jgi:hypothetical protein|nr:MAG: hypothetical protein D8H93_16085 [Capnocytophaga sp.]